MSWRSDEIDKEEARFYANRENTADRLYYEREMEKDACYERCQQCEEYDHEEGVCMIGENMMKCDIWN